MLNQYRITIICMLILIGALLTHQQGFFLPEAVIAGECHTSKFESSESRMRLIELYTSEGCSSCPPADRWVSSLRNHKNLGKTFFPLKFHVDYWNYLGWKDQLSNPKFTTRQRQYATEWKARNIYTPGFSLDGKEWRGWRLQNPPKESREKPGVLKATHQQGKFKIEFSGTNSKDLRLNFAIVGNGISHRIKTGENSGKTLKHNFSVLHFEKFKFTNNMSITVPKVTIQAPEKMVVFWLDGPKTQIPIQAVSGCIN